MDDKTQNPYSAFTRNKNPGMHTILKGNFTWFFSGGEEASTDHGVAIVISRDFIHHLQDVVNIDERMMYIILKGEIRINIINAYAPTAPDSTERKDFFL